MLAAPTLLAGYLVLVLPPLLVQNPDPTGLLLAASHVGAAALLVRRARTAPEGIDAWAWLPLVAVPFLYAELPLLNQWIGPGYHDAAVQGWERALFGGAPSAAWAQAMPWLPLSEVLHAGYLSYYPLIHLPFAVLHLKRRPEDFRLGASAVLLAFVLCYVVFIVFPVQGPRYLDPRPAAVPMGPFRWLALTILESGSSRGAAFPSSHVAVGVVQALVVGSAFGRGAGLAMGAVALALAGGAVYGGFHYAVDALAGAAVGVAAFAAVRAAGYGASTPSARPPSPPRASRSHPAPARGTR